METRQQAMNWWNNLPDFGNPSKHLLCTMFYNSRLFQTLTGREIEKIWKSENNK